MIVVDTSVWASFFNGTRTPHVERLHAAFDNAEDVAIVPVILTEVLQGFRHDSSFERARALLLQLPIVSLDTPGHVEAARLFRGLRKKGITVRGTIDCIIAQTCIEADAELLSPDRDFAAIARHVPLRLCAA